MSTSARPNLVDLPALTAPTEGTTLFVVQDSAVSQTLTVPIVRELLNTIGPTGPTGPLGDVGTSGFSGWSGFSGYSGQSGVSGFSGYSGPSGYSGYSGVSGYSGYSGVSGYSGYSGRSGYSGYSGYSGDSGYSGYSGYSGIVGPTGPTGPAGNLFENIAGGTAGNIPIQTAVSATSFIGLGPAGSLLRSDGINTATWISTTTLYVGNAVNANRPYLNLYSVPETFPNKYLAMATSVGGFADLGTTSSVVWNANNRTLTVDGEILATKLTIELTTVTTTEVTTDDVFTIKNLTNSTSTDSGALVVAGGVGIAQDIYIGGILSIGPFPGTGNKDAIELNNNNIAGVNAIKFRDPGPNEGIVWEQGYLWRIWESPDDLVTTTAGNLQIVTNGNTRVATFNTSGQVSIVAAIEALSTNSGALIVAGGVGIGGDIWVGGSINVGGTINATIVGITSTATNIQGGSEGQVPFQTSPGLTLFAGPGSTGSLLVSRGASSLGPEFISTSNIYIGAAVTATNLSGGAAGRLPYQSSTSTTAFANEGTPGSILVSRGSLGPIFASTTTIYIGNSAYSNTATNLKDGLTGQVPYQNSPGSTLFTGPGTAGSIFVSNGSFGPSFASTSSIYVGRAATAESSEVAVFTTYALNLNGGNGGSVPYQNATSSTVFVPIATTSGWVLTSNGSIPYWGPAPGSTGFASSSTTATNIANGAIGQILYQSAPGATSFAGPGTAGHVLVSRGANALGPEYRNTVTIQTISVGSAWYGGVIGEIRAANEITAYYGSDLRLKENIKQIDDPIGKLNKIRGVTFDWKADYILKRGGEDGYFVRKHDVGVIAQEIEAVLPEVVGTRDDGMKVVKYEKLTALLIEAVKELSKEIEQLKSKKS